MAMTYGDIYVASTSLEVRQLHAGTSLGSLASELGGTQISQC